jgi:hypothetical protein
VGMETRHTREPNDEPGADGHHLITGECFACLVGVATGPESHGDYCPHAAPRDGEREDRR